MTSGVPDKGMNERDILVLVFLSGLFSAAIVFANIAAGVKIVRFLGFIIPAGTIAYCFTFPITDIVEEVYGRGKAVHVVWAGLGAEVLMLLLALVGWYLPALEPGMEELYRRVFSPQIRIVAASLIAYVISQHHDVWAFWKWREVTGGRWLWVRNNASTMISQLIDTAIFTAIAFYGVVSLQELTTMVISTWLFKVIIAAADTPFVYLGVWLVRKYVRTPQITGILRGVGHGEYQTR